MKERILKEIEGIQTYIEDCTEERNSLLNHVDNYDECEYLFDQIRKYSNYKVALEQAVNDFPIELGSY